MRNVKDDAINAATREDNEMAYVSFWEWKHLRKELKMNVTMFLTKIVSLATVNNWWNFFALSD